jgi:4-hydroxybenzoate polyprenyltransferase
LSDHPIAVAPRPSLARLAYAMLRCYRPRQLPKNLLIFAPAIFSRRTHDKWILDPEIFTSLVITFLLFSLLVGSTYIVNDYVDLEKDRTSPDKSHRPITSGTINATFALVVGILGIVGALSVQILRDPVVARIRILNALFR